MIKSIDYLFNFNILMWLTDQYYVCVCGCNHRKIIIMYAGCMGEIRED